MKNKKFLLALMLTATNSLFANGIDMKLINTKTGYILVEFKEGKTLFHDRFLEAEMLEKGVFIPKNRRSDFQGKQMIKLDDPLFQKAFKEIYVPLTIASSLYQWR